MNLDELKQLAQEDEEIEQRPQDIFCPVCERQRRQVIITYRQLQIRTCEGLQNKKHTLYFDPKGKYLWAVEHHDGTVDWRYKIDFDRTEGQSHWDRTWDNPRRKGGRKKGGSGWTEYVEDE